MESLLARVTPAERQALALRYVRDLRLRDAAACARRSASAVVQAEQRGLVRLRQLLVREDAA